MCRQKFPEVCGGIKKYLEFSRMVRCDWKCLEVFSSGLRCPEVSTGIGRGLSKGSKRCSLKKDSVVICW